MALLPETTAFPMKLGAETNNKECCENWSTNAINGDCVPTCDVSMSEKLQHDLQKELATAAKMDQKALGPIATAELIESCAAYNVWIDVPGVEDIEVSLQDRWLFICCDRKHCHEDDDNANHKTEKCCVKVQRKLQVPSNGNLDLAAATYKNGVLCIHIPKTSSTGVKRPLPVN